MTKPTKQHIEEYIRNNKLDVDESYPRSDWWKFKQQRDAYKQQRDELIKDIAQLRERNAELEKKAKAFDEILNCAGGNSMDVGDDINRIVDEYYEEEQND